MRHRLSGFQLGHQYNLNSSLPFAKASRRGRRSRVHRRPPNANNEGTAEDGPEIRIDHRARIRYNFMFVDDQTGAPLKDLWVFYVGSDENVSDENQ